MTNLNLTTEQDPKIIYLLTNGFKKVEGSEYNTYTKDVHFPGDRFAHTLNYFDDEDIIYVNAHLMRGEETRSYDKYMQNHNELSTGIKNYILELEKVGFSFFND